MTAPQNPPRPVVDETGVVSSIPQLLRSLGIDVPEGDLGDTPENQLIAVEWLRAERKAGKRPHVHLLVGFYLRQWLEEGEYEELWDWVTSDR